MSAQASAELRSPALSRGAEPAPILKTELLTVRFGGLTAVNDVTFNIPVGSIVALIAAVTM